MARTPKRKFIQLKTDDKPRKVTRVDYENFFIDMLHLMLPSVPRGNIRPSYLSKVNLAVITEEQPDYITVTKGIDDKDTVIYIKVIFDQDAVEAYTHEDGHIKQQRLITLKCEVYGEKSQQIAIMLNALIRADYILQYLTHGGMWLYSSPSAISEVHEFINGLWYERHDLEFEFNECLEIDVPKLPDTALIVPLNVNGTQDKDIEVDKE